MRIFLKYFVISLVLTLSIITIVLPNFCYARDKSISENQSTNEACETCEACEACEVCETYWVKINKAEAGFNQRWNNFTKNHKIFDFWTYNWNAEELKVNFDKMYKERLAVYFVDSENFDKKDFLCQRQKDYQIPENWKSQLSRYKYPLALTYNIAFPNYNCSIIFIDNITFLAMEAPCDKNVDLFFKILDEYKITDLVRLTPHFYKNREGSFPYWEGLIDIHSTNGSTTIEIANREINYFPTDCWKDHHGIEPKKLLSLIKAVKNSEISDPKIIAVHCRAGVGRTGTFIAAYVLITEIDKQINSGIDIKNLKISIDEIFWKLSLQRPFAITHFEQYLTLYALANYYIDILK